MATGYERRLPFLPPELYSAGTGGPNLYLNLFSRAHDGLAMMGLSDFAGGDLPPLRRHGPGRHRRHHPAGAGRRRVAGVATEQEEDRVDLRGGTEFIDTPMHEIMVDDHAYQVRFRDLCDQFGYTPGPVRRSSRLIVGAGAR